MLETKKKDMERNGKTDLRLTNYVKYLIGE